MVGREKHGMYGTKEYNAWRNMLNRCYNPNYVGSKNYMERGIVVCERWRSGFSFFIKDMGLSPSSGHTLDRIDNNGNYEPSNCKWSTRSEQNYNRRKPKLQDRSLSGVAGITFSTQRKKWRVRIKEKNIDSFFVELEYAKAFHKQNGR